MNPIAEKWIFTICFIDDRVRSLNVFANFKSGAVWIKVAVFYTKKGGFRADQWWRFIGYFCQSEMTWQLSHPSLMWVYWSETINFVDDDGFGSRYLLNSNHLTNFNYDKAFWISQDGNDMKCHDDNAMIRFVIPSKLSSIAVQLILSTNDVAQGSSG